MTFPRVSVSATPAQLIVFVACCCSNWCVLKGVTLYIYDYPIDEEALDTIELPGYEVHQLQQQQQREAWEDEEEERELVWELSHDVSACSMCGLVNAPRITEMSVTREAHRYLPSWHH